MHLGHSCLVHVGTNHDRAAARAAGEHGAQLRGLAHGARLRAAGTMRSEVAFFSRGGRASGHEGGRHTKRSPWAYVSIEIISYTSAAAHLHGFSARCASAAQKSVSPKFTGMARGCEVGRSPSAPKVTPSLMGTVSRRRRCLGHRE